MTTGNAYCSFSASQHLSLQSQLQSAARQCSIEQPILKTPARLRCPAGVFYVLISTQPLSTETHQVAPIPKSFFIHTHRHWHYTSARQAIHPAPAPPRLSPTRHILFIHLPHLFSPYQTQAENISYYNINLRALQISLYRIMKQPLLTPNMGHIMP